MKKVILWGILIFIGYKLYQKYMASQQISTTAANVSPSTGIVPAATTITSQAITTNPGSSASGNLLDPGIIIGSRDMAFLQNQLID